MEPALLTAKTGLDAHRRYIEVTGNNLANLNTTGFKRDRAVFNSLSYQEIVSPGAQQTQDTNRPTGLMIGTGVRVSNTEKVFMEGSQLRTEKDLDMMIVGRGFFKVTHNDGIAYTRDGTFQLNENGEVVTPFGDLLEPAITVPEGTVSIDISSDGVISALVSGSTTPQELGQLEIATFINPAGLKPIGDNLYLETQASGAEIAGTPGSEGFGRIEQGALEASNVNVVEELVNLIGGQRAFEITSRVMETVDQMLEYFTRQT
jgi:flagellar basal-body rod protein FlgG